MSPHRETVRQYTIGAIDTSLRFRLVRGAPVRAHDCGAIIAGGAVPSLMPHAIDIDGR